MNVQFILTHIDRHLDAQQFLTVFNKMRWIRDEEEIARVIICINILHFKHQRC